MDSCRGAKSSHPFARPFSEEDGTAWWALLLILLGVAVAIAVVAVLVSPGINCHLDPPCALPAASTPSESMNFVTEPVGEPPSDGWVEVVPSEVYVEPGTGGTQFSVEAVLRDKDGFVVPPVLAPTLTWNVDPPLTKVGTGVRTVTLSVPGSITQAKNPTVSAATTSSTVSPSASVTVRMMPASTADRLNANHASGATPTAALADVKLKDNTLLADKPMAFVRERVLGDVEQGGPAWGSVVILSPSQSAEVVQPPATGAGVGFSIAAPQSETDISAPSMLDVDVAVWVAVPASDVANGVVPADVAAQAKADLLWANDAYARSRAGLHFVIWNGAPDVFDPGDATEADIVNKVATACKNQTWTDLPVREPKKLNIYYVGSSGPEGISGLANGEPVACLAWVSIRSLSVLAHELGHTLGLKDEYVWPETPFTAANVMGYLRSTHTAPRDQLSVGQVFRVVLSSNSWLIGGGLVAWSGVDCSTTACPVEALDLPRTPKP